MKLLSRYIIVQCLLCLALSVSAHSPDVSSTFLVEETEGKWVLQIRAALTAFEYEIENHFGQSSYATPEEFQELVVQHVHKNMSITTNDDYKVVIQNGIVKLGHETSVTFEVIGIPSNLEEVYITNSSFQNIPRNQSALIVLKKGFTKSQFKLDRNNAHTAALKVADSKFEIVAPAQEASGFPFSYMWIGVLTCAFIFLTYQVISRFRIRSSIQVDTVNT